MGETARKLPDDDGGNVREGKTRWLPGSSAIRRCISVSTIRVTAMIMRVVCFAICSIVSGNLACDPLTAEQRGNLVVTISAYMDQCIQGDDLLRSTCSRIAAHLSERNRKYCELPADSFQQRTDRDYRDFQASFHADIESKKDTVEAAMRKTRDAFDTQFAQLRAGKVSMLDLESLHRFLGDNCLTIEKEWLPQLKKGRP
jgi:hypothetical protein